MNGVKDAKRKIYPAAEDLRAGRHVPNRDSVWRHARTSAGPVVEVNECKSLNARMGVNVRINSMGKSPPLDEYTNTARNKS